MQKLTDKQLAALKTLYDAQGGNLNIVSPQKILREAGITSPTHYLRVLIRDEYIERTGDTTACITDKARLLFQEPEVIPPSTNHRNGGGIALLLDTHNIVGGSQGGSLEHIVKQLLNTITRKYGDPSHLFAFVNERGEHYSSKLSKLGFNVIICKNLSATEGDLVDPILELVGNALAIDVTIKTIILGSGDHHFIPLVEFAKKHGKKTVAISTGPIAAELNAVVETAFNLTLNQYRNEHISDLQKTAVAFITDQKVDDSSVQFLKLVVDILREIAKPELALGYHELRRGVGWHLILNDVRGQSVDAESAIIKQLLELYNLEEFKQGLILGRKIPKKTIYYLNDEHPLLQKLEDWNP